MEYFQSSSSRTKNKIQHDKMQYMASHWLAMWRRRLKQIALAYLGKAVLQRIPDIPGSKHNQDISFVAFLHLEVSQFTNLSKGSGPLWTKSAKANSQMPFAAKRATFCQIRVCQFWSRKMKVYLKFLRVFELWPNFLSECSQRTDTTEPAWMPASFLDKVARKCG